MQDVRYMVQWKEGDVWLWWDGVLKDDQEPPFKVMIVKTGWTYSWENFQKVRLRG